MNLYYIGNALGLSALYMLAGTGSITAIKNGEFNLGGEGQIYAGGFVCAIILAAFGKGNTIVPPVIAVSISFLAAGFVSGLLGLLSAVFKNYKNAEPLFTSFIVSAAVIPLIDGLIAGKFRTTTGNLLSTAFINQAYRFKSILPPSFCNAVFIIAICLCVGAFFVFERTGFGRRLCITGISNEFAKYSGYNVHGITDAALGISGAFHGICGAAAICGTYFTCHSGFYSGIGWNALSAALIASSNPILLIPSSIVLAFIITYANKFALFNNLGFDVSGLIQGLILFVIAFIITKNKGAEK